MKSAGVNVQDKKMENRGSIVRPRYILSTIQQADPQTEWSGSGPVSSGIRKSHICCFFLCFITILPYSETG